MPSTTASARLVAALESVDPADMLDLVDRPDRRLHRRRQAHEALIHRLDAELTAGAVSGLDPALAADGVQECLAVMYGGSPAWGTFTPGEGAAPVDLTDVDQRCGCGSAGSPAPTPTAARRTTNRTSASS